MACLRSIRCWQKAFTAGALPDTSLIRERLNNNKRLISAALTGTVQPHAFKDCQPGNFADETHYTVSLLDLVLNLYAIPLSHAGFAPLRRDLHERWQHTLTSGHADGKAAPFKIFVSYSHKDERFKNELVTMLAGLERRRVVDAWQDRRLEAGDDWHASIDDAMDQCDLALLLVSPDYLKSRFIQEEEQPRLLKRRAEMRVRVLPIIVRPCNWQSEPVLKDLQVMPRDGKAIITFSKSTGARDQAWVDVAAVIEANAKRKRESPS